MIVERFSKGNSLFHTIDPRIKICIALPLVFAIALSNNLIVITVSLIVAISFMLLARLNLRFVVKSLRVLFVFIALLWLFLPISIPGNAVCVIGPVTLSAEGLFRALSITIKSITIILLIITLLSTSSVFTLAHALSHLQVPRKLLWLLFLSYRYIFVLYVEYLKLRNALIIRGFRPKTNIHTYKTFAYLIGMLLVRSYERSERIYNAMLCRGFQGKFYLLDHFEIGKKDILFLVLMTLFLFGVIWFEWITKIV